MKTNIFSFSRVGLLFQRYFTERFNTELIYWSIMIIVFMLIRNSIQATGMLILVGGIFYAARFFREIHSRSNGVAYFMIPATHLEKITVGILMTSFYYFAMMIITYILGNLMGTFLNNILASIDIAGINYLFKHSPLQWNLFELGSSFRFMGTTRNSGYIWFFVFFLFSQSIYLLGSIYFKSNQFFKTFLSVCIIQFLLIILFIIELRLFIGFGDHLNNINFNRDFGNSIGNILRYVHYLLPPFFWIVSYFRLTEKEV